MTQPAPSSLAPRLLAGLAGGLALLGLVSVTFGAALTAIIGMGVAALILRSRGRPFTRLGSWLGAVGGVAVAVTIAITIALALGSDSLMSAMQQSAELERTREPNAVERTMERMSPRTPASSAMERRMEEVATSGPFMWASIMLGGAMMSAFAGLLLGSATWVCAIVGLYGITGRWPPRAREGRDDGAPPLRGGADAR